MSTIAMGKEFTRVRNVRTVPAYPSRRVVGTVRRPVVSCRVDRTELGTVSTAVLKLKLGVIALLTAVGAVVGGVNYVQAVTEDVPQETTVMLATALDEE